MSSLAERLRELWRECDALGGAPANDWDLGYNAALTAVSDKLEAVGFSEGRSEAADHIAELEAEVARLTKALGKAQATITNITGLVVRGQSETAMKIAEEYWDRWRALLAKQEPTKE